ncbi:MAG: glycosyltransferase [Acidimicrobiales bacterium]
MRRLAVLSMHTSPLAQPGSGDGGGMNVYVRELSGALARAGVDCDVYTRAWCRGLPPVVAVEPGLRVHHVIAGRRALLPMAELADLVGDFTEGVQETMAAGSPPDAIHANYWLSGVAGHELKHRFELPLVSTFHTLDRVKAEAVGDEDGRRARAEAEVIGCSDAILASSGDEAEQLVRLYGAVPERVEVVPPGVDHHLFSPGDRAAARRALGQSLGLPPGPMLLFVGRIQPLKGVDVAVRALAALGGDVTLVVVGGPSGPHGEAELARIGKLVSAHGLAGRVRFLPPQPHGHLADFYRAADVCVVPSRSESFGLVALEAAACGTPVVAAAVGGLRTIVTSGRTGFLVEERDPAVFAARIGELLDDPGLADRMGAQAAAWSRQFQWPITAARLRRLYADLTARQRVECG